MTVRDETMFLYPIGNRLMSPKLLQYERSGFRFSARSGVGGGAGSDSIQ